MEIWVFISIVFIGYLTAILAVWDGRESGLIIGGMTALFVQSTPYLSSYVHTFRDSYLYFIASKAIMASHGFSPPESTVILYGGVESKVVFYVMGVITAVVGEVTGITDFSTLRIAIPILLFIPTYMGVIYVFRQLLSKQAANIGAIIYSALYLVTTLFTTYHQQLTGVFAFVFLFGVLLASMRSKGDYRFKVLSLIFIVTLVASHNFTPILVTGFLVLMVPISAFYSWIWDHFQPDEKPMLQRLHYPAALILVLGLGTVILRMYFTKDFFQYSVLKSIALLLSKDVPSGGIAASGGPTTILNQIPIITLLLTLLLTSYGTVIHWRDGKVSIAPLIHLGVAVSITLPFMLIAGLTRGLLFAYLPAIGIAAFALIRKLRPPSLSANSLPTIGVVVVIALLLVGNGLYAVTPSKIDGDADIMRDGYHGFEPLSQQYVEAGEWIGSSFSDDTTIYSRDRLRSAVIYYGKYPYWAMLHPESTPSSQDRILFDTKRTEVGRVQNLYYTNGRLHIASFDRNTTISVPEHNPTKSQDT